MFYKFISLNPFIKYKKYPWELKEIETIDEDYDEYSVPPNLNIAINHFKSSKI